MLWRVLYFLLCLLLYWTKFLSICKVHYVLSAFFGHLTGPLSSGLPLHPLKASHSLTPLPGRISAFSAIFSFSCSFAVSNLIFFPTYSSILFFVLSLLMSLFFPDSLSILLSLSPLLPTLLLPDYIFIYFPLAALGACNIIPSRLSMHFSVLSQL